MTFSVKAQLNDLAIRSFFYNVLHSREWITCLNGICCRTQGGFLKTKHFHVAFNLHCPTPADTLSPKRSLVQTHCDRAYRQSQWYFNCTPQYLICWEGTLEGLQSKRAHSVIEPFKDHVKSLVLMKTRQGDDRKVKAWLGVVMLVVMGWWMYCSRGWTRTWSEDGQGFFLYYKEASLDFRNKNMI